VRVARAVHQRLARLHLLAFLNFDVHTAGQRVLALFAIFAFDEDLALALGDFAVLHRAVDLRHDGRLPRLARFEQLDNSRQTAGDVLGLRRLARDLRNHVARVDFLAIAHHQVSVGRHMILLGFGARALCAFGAHDDHRLPLFIRRVGDHELAHAGHFVHLLLQRQALDQVLEMDHAADLRQDRESVRIPFEQDLVGLHCRAVFDHHARAVVDGVALLFTPLLVHDRHDAVAIHRDQLAVLALHGLDADVARVSVALGVLRGLFTDARRRTTDMERTHRQLRAGFADRLRRDHTDRFAALDQPAGRKVAAIARDTNAALGFARQHRADLHALDTGRLNRRRQVFSDLLVDADDYVAFVVLLIFQRHAAHDAVAQRLDDFA